MPSYRPSLSVREHSQIHISLDFRAIVTTGRDDVKCTLSHSERRMESRILFDVRFGSLDNRIENRAVEACVFTVGAGAMYSTPKLAPHAR